MRQYDLGLDSVSKIVINRIGKYKSIHKERNDQLETNVFTLQEKNGYSLPAVRFETLRQANGRTHPEPNILLSLRAEAPVPPSGAAISQE